MINRESDGVYLIVNDGRTSSDRLISVAFNAAKSIRRDDSPYGKYPTTYSSSDYDAAHRDEHPN